LFKSGIKIQVGPTHLSSTLSRLGPLARHLLPPTIHWGQQPRGASTGVRPDSAQCISSRPAPHRPPSAVRTLSALPHHPPESGTGLASFVSMFSPAEPPFPATPSRRYAAPSTSTSSEAGTPLHLLPLRTEQSPILPKAATECVHLVAGSS
jgi:hypothetical protein